MSQGMPVIFPELTALHNLKGLGNNNIIVPLEATWLSSFNFMPPTTEKWSSWEIFRRDKHRSHCHIPAILLLSDILVYFTFMLPCIVIVFFLNNQPDPLIIPILFCYKALHVSGIFSAHHQEFSTVHSALVSFMQVTDDRFQAEPGWNSVPNVQ